MESRSRNRPGGGHRIRVRMLGPLAVCRDDIELALPRSRKVRALLAWLALAPHATARSALCELLWDAPGDPRAELRWCLSKIRHIVDEPHRRRVVTRDDAIRLDLADCGVDALAVSHALEPGAAMLAPDRQRMLCSQFQGDFLEGLEIDRSPVFTGWLTAQRRRYRQWHVALLGQLARNSSGDDALGFLEEWLGLAPFDLEANEMLLLALAGSGRLREAEEHLATAVRLFEAEGLDCMPIRQAWRSAKAQGNGGGALRLIAGPPAAADATTGAGDGSGRPPAPPAAPVPASVIAETARDDPKAVPLPVATRRASIAVMPFADESDESDTRGGGGGAAGALVHDLITRIAKLRCLFVIAQGTVFALHERRVGPEEAGRMLDVDYVVGGSVRRRPERLTVAVELVETRSGRIVWAEIFNRKPDDAFLMLDEIGNTTVASVVSEIEANERNRAILKPPGSLDAWEAHHRGLWHMYRFSRPDNDHARHYFETALRLDPTFARAWAGLSFTHFQNAFQGWAEREPEIGLALEAAAKSLMADDRDPAAHWSMGRALWLRGNHDASVTELEQAVELSPNFALGHYTLAFVHSQDGDPGSAITSADHSRHLSPFDPLLFGMLGARAIALVRLGRFDEAAMWATRAAAQPNAHPHIHAIAACSLALAGALDEGRARLASIRHQVPGYSLDDFLRAFRFDSRGATLFGKAGRRIGMK